MATTLSDRIQTHKDYLKFISWLEDIDTKDRILRIHSWAQDKKLRSNPRVPYADYGAWVVLTGGEIHHYGFESLLLSMGIGKVLVEELYEKVEVALNSTGKKRVYGTVTQDGDGMHYNFFPDTYRANNESDPESTLEKMADINFEGWLEAMEVPIDLAKHEAELEGDDFGIELRYKFTEENFIVSVGLERGHGHDYYTCAIPLDSKFPERFIAYNRWQLGLFPEEKPVHMRFSEAEAFFDRRTLGA
ncbi:MAG: hypothetical protein KJ709_08110 [Nanoarchaeota archaeon]|nr:hypothetical protein [Nanoarchaeota archaeon]